MPIKLSTSLTNTIADRHLLYNLPAINVRMIQISFTVEYDIKKQHKTNYWNTWHHCCNIMCDWTSEHNFPYSVTRMLITTPNLLSQAHFHHILSTRFQKNVHHIRQWVIRHSLFFSFIQFQYVLPLRSTNKLLAVCCNQTTKIQCTAKRAWSLCLWLSLVYKWNQKIQKWNCFSCDEYPMLQL